VFNACRLEENKTLQQRETLAVRSRVYIYNKLEKANKKKKRDKYLLTELSKNTFKLGWKSGNNHYTYIKIKENKNHSPVDPSILEPVYRQGGALNNMEGAPGLSGRISLAKEKPTETPEI
jgi:hypothetical protein